MFYEFDFRPFVMGMVINISELVRYTYSKHRKLEVLYHLTTVDDC